MAIHINTTLTEDEFESVRARQLEEEAAVEAETDKGRVLDRAKYGIFVGKIGKYKVIFFKSEMSDLDPN